MPQSYKKGPAPKSPAKNDTSWNRVAGWYERLLEGEGTYQKDLILPNLLRLMDIGHGDHGHGGHGATGGANGEAVLDLACGPGFFAREFAAAGANVIGVDASQALIEMARADVRAKAGYAKENARGAKAIGREGIAGSSIKASAMQFFVSRADKLPFVKSATMDKVAIVLALQNIENAGDVLKECSRVLKQSGQLFIVLNHPAFRVPQSSNWGWDEKTNVQYRRVDKYLSEAKIAIQMHPGALPGDAKHGETTISFHRPLQLYFKLLSKAGFTVAALEEWNSNRKSETGPRARAEDVARKEIPLFLCLVAVKK